MKIPYKTILCCALIISCSRSQNPTVEDLRVGRDFAIMDILGDKIDDEFSEVQEYFVLHEKPMVVHDQFWLSGHEGSELEYLSLQLPDAPLELLQLLLNEKEGTTRNNGLSSEPAIKMLSTRVFQQLYFGEDEGPGDFWDSLRRDSPGCVGILNTSEVAYSPELSQAVVVFSWACGSPCGSCWIIWLEFADGQWSVLGKENLWIA